MANPLLLIGASVAAFALLNKKKETSSSGSGSSGSGSTGSGSTGNTSPPNPEGMTQADLKATEPVKREKGNTSLDTVDQIVELIGIKHDPGFDYPGIVGYEPEKDETMHSYLFRVMSSRFKLVYGEDFYKPSATPLNSNDPKTNFTACNCYYFLATNVVIGNKTWPAGTILHGAQDDFKLIAGTANAKNSLVPFEPDDEWENIYNNIVDIFIKFYIDGGSNIAARLLMFSILCAESYGIVLLSQARYDFTGMTVMVKCRQAYPNAADWITKQYYRYCGIVRIATFTAFVKQALNRGKVYNATGWKDSLRKIFGYFDASDYASNSLLNKLKEEVLKEIGL